MLFLLSRVPPIVLSFLLAWWARRWLGSKALEPVLLLSLIATSLALRLVFEPMILGHHLAAVAVVVIFLDVAKRQLSRQTIAWLALLGLAFDPVPLGFVSNALTEGPRIRELLPTLLMFVAVALVAFDVVRRRFRLYVVAWLTIVSLISSDGHGTTRCFDTRCHRRSGR